MGEKSELEKFVESKMPKNVEEVMRKAFARVTVEGQAWIRVSIGPLGVKMSLERPTIPPIRYPNGMTSREYEEYCENYEIKVKAWVRDDE